MPTESNILVFLLSEWLLISYCSPVVSRWILYLQQLYQGRKKSSRQVPAEHTSLLRIYLKAPNKNLHLTSHNYLMGPSLAARDVEKYAFF